MSALDEFAKFCFEHGKTLMAHREAGRLWQEASAEYKALRTRLEAEEAENRQLKADLLNARELLNYALDEFIPEVTPLDDGKVP